MYNPFTDTWTTLTESTNERYLVYEFSWEGDRITRMKNRQSDFTVSYDDAGRIILINRLNGVEASYEYSYDDDGRLSHSFCDGIGHHDIVDYTWANGHIQKSVMEWISVSPDETLPTRHETCEFTWNGDILSSTVRHYENADGTSGVMRYDYEYTSIPNPFQDFVYCMAATTGLIWGSDGIDGQVRNMYSHISNDLSDFYYEYTTSGNRIQTITETQVSESSNGVTTLRVTSESLFELEYAD